MAGLELYVPAETVVEERDLVVPGDAILCDSSTIDLGVRAETILAGRAVHVGGHIEAAGDCYLDADSHVDAKLLVGRRAALGADVTAAGPLRCGGNVLRAATATVRGGVAATGTDIRCRPRSAALFAGTIFWYLLSGGTLAPPAPFVCPRDGKIGDARWQVDTPAIIGERCRLHGNLHATACRIGTDTTVFGSLTAPNGIELASGVDIVGDVTAHDGTVRINGDARVRGDIRCESLVVSKTAAVEGTMRATETVEVCSSTTSDPAE
ncbi:MAG: polymer-forming cytoskeletal protein [Salinarchaeum sp.]